MKNSDVPYMIRALDLAKLGSGTVSPNPMVGAVIVDNFEKIVGEGFHQKKGGPHAEVFAIEDALKNKANLKTSTLYCTLEPCCHTNKTTPPCTDLIIKSEIPRVVVGCLDPNPSVAGKGVEKLKENGIEVFVGVCEDKCQELNKIFFKNMKSKLPYVHIKVAGTLDGRIATQSGSSKWITSDRARMEVHELRKNYDAVMIGKNTLRIDNPSLTARLESSTLKDPYKIIVGNLESGDLSLKAFNSTDKVINIYTKSPLNTEIKSIKHEGSWEKTLIKLYELGVCSILVEGGSVLLSSLLKDKVFDQFSYYISPKIVGNGPSFFNDEAVKNMEDANGFHGAWRSLGNNEIVFEGAL